jgi:hypothetical protein
MVYRIVMVKRRMGAKRCEVAVFLVSDRRNGISADGRMVNCAVTFLVDLADEDAGKRNTGVKLARGETFGVGKNRVIWR